MKTLLICLIGLGMAGCNKTPENKVDRHECNMRSSVGSFKVSTVTLSERVGEK